MDLEGFPKSIVLKNGAHASLEVAGAGDGPALLAFYRAQPAEDRLFLKDDVTTAAWAERFLVKIAQGEVISLVAKQDGKIVAEGTLYRTLHGWTRHVGEIRIAVDRSQRKVGLGTGLASALVKVATNVGIEKIIVEVTENQLGARRTFEKLGFHGEAILRRHVMDISGIKRDLLILANDVSQIWAAMEAMVADEPPMGE